MRSREAPPVTQPLCTVRDCRAPLVRDERRLVCANRHSFDIARSGYVNLLQPQDRRSRNPGDTAEAVAARRRFYERGFDAPVVEAIVGAVPLHAGDAVLDVGCGEGHHLAALQRAHAVAAHGVDISIPAIELAARRFRDCSWLVANADRFLPYPDASFAAVTSITARLNPEEFRRVLRPEGTLLVVVPGADDLIELRALVQGQRLERDRADRTADLFSALFTLQRRETVRHSARLDRAAMIDVMCSSYRGLRTRERARLEALPPTTVTLARDLLWLQPA